MSEFYQSCYWRWERGVKRGRVIRGGSGTGTKWSGVYVGSGFICKAFIFFVIRIMWKRV